MGRAATPHKAVVVEPVLRLRELVAVLLEETGYEVEDSSSLEEALALLTSKGVDVALLFIDLPAAAIESAARTIAGRWPWIRLIVPRAPQERSARFPSSTYVMTSPWNALDVLIQAERARQSVAQSAAR